MLFFDTESTDLAASWGRILCASFVDLSGEVYTYRADRKPHKGKEMVDDAALCAAIRDELETADIIVGWNSILHDIPLLNARLQVGGEREFRGKQWPRGGHLDLMFYAGGQSLKVGGRKLDTVARFFGTAHQKTPLDGVTWQRAAAFDQAAMDQVVEHCEADVLVLRDTYPELVRHVKKFVLPMAAWWPWAEQIGLAT